MFGEAQSTLREEALKVSYPFIIRQAFTILGYCDYSIEVDYNYKNNKLKPVGTLTSDSAAVHIEEIYQYSNLLIKYFDKYQVDKEVISSIGYIINWALTFYRNKKSLLDESTYISNNIYERFIATLSMCLELENTDMKRRYNV